MSDQPSTPPPLPKSRHLCLAILLIFLIATNALLLLATPIVLLLYTLSPQFEAELRRVLPNTPIWVMGLSMGVVALRLIALIALIAIWRWKFWGFAGYVFTTLLMIGLSLIFYSGGIFDLLKSLLYLGLLYGALQLGRENKGWTQLE